MDLKLLKWFIMNFVISFIVFLVFMQFSTNDLFAIILLIILCFVSVKLLPTFAKSTWVNKVISIVIIVATMFFVANSWLNFLDIILIIAVPILFYFGLKHYFVTGRVLPSKKWLLISLAVIIIILIVLNFLGLLYFLNGPLSSLKGRPKTDCTTDDDCMLMRTTCFPCDCYGTAVSEEWKPFCPFKNPLVMCEMCPDRPDVKCVDSKCETVWN